MPIWQWVQKPNNCIVCHLYFCTSMSIVILFFIAATVMGMLKWSRDGKLGNATEYHLTNRNEVTRFGADNAMPMTKRTTYTKMLNK